MATPLKTTKETLKILGCARSTLTQHKEKLSIQPATKGNANYYTEEQIEAIKQSLQNVPIQQPSASNQSMNSQVPVNDRLSNSHKSNNSNSEVSHKSANQSELLEHLKQELERSREELKAVREKNQNTHEKKDEKIQALSEKVGFWEGKAHTYQELNQKLLEQQKEKKPEREAVIITPPPEKEGEIMEADLKEEEKIPEKNSGKKSWWARFWSE